MIVCTLSPRLLDARNNADVATNALRTVAALATAKKARSDLTVVTLPLGCLTGQATGSDEPVTPAALEPLAEAARVHGVWIAGADRFVDGVKGFLLTPESGLALMQPLLSEADGRAQVEVADTPCGRAAVLVGGDVLHAEYVRLAMFQGAELVLNPCAEFLDERSEARDMSRAARCWENLLAMASCGLRTPDTHAGSPSQRFVGTGYAAIWASTGQKLAYGDGVFVAARMDPISVRARRTDPWINFPGQLRTALYAERFAAAARGEMQPTTGSAVSKDAAFFDVLMLQAHQIFVSGPEDRDEIIGRNLDNAFAIATPFCSRPTTRLVVFPEFFLQGSNGSHPHDWWEKVGIRIPGPETDRLAAFARKNDVYVCGAVLEYDPEWPMRYFNTSIIVSPDGEIILRYRKLQCADLNGLMNITTPGNIYSKYVERYGIESLIPVVDTPIGRLGTLICYDSNWPELWRCLALAGAEVICNPTSEIHSNRRQFWYPSKRAHAAEHQVYVASANAGSEQFTHNAPVTGMNRGHSALIDFNGQLAACGDGPGVIPLVGRVELGALRRARAARLGSHEGRFRPEAVAAAYAAFPGFPLDCFLAKPMIEAWEGSDIVRAQIDKYRSVGIFRDPQ